jgi:hypothetical protein
MLKKLLTSSVILVITASCAVAQSVNVVTIGSPGGMINTIIDKEVVPNIKNYKQTIFTEGCKAAADYLNSTKEPTIAFWDVEDQIPGPNGEATPCNIPHDMIVDVIWAWDYKLCTRGEDAAIHTLDAFKTDNITVGARKHPVWFVEIEQLIKDINPNAKVIPYKSSRDYRAALASKEVDYLFVTSPKPDMQCYVTTNATGYGTLQPTTTITDSPFARTMARTTLAYKNMTREEAQTIYNDIVNSEEHKEMLEQEYTLPADVNYHEFIKDYLARVAPIVNK